MTKIEFLQKAKITHGIEYEYIDIPNTIKWGDKIKILCKKHGIFSQIVSNHLAGKGCIKCNVIEKRRLTTDAFIKKAKEFHGSRYDYSKCNYINTRTPVVITCKTHGDFSITPNKHTSSKRGCKKCAMRKTTKKFIKEAVGIHGDKYIYTDTNYIKHNIKVTIVCPIHGDFKITPFAHIKNKTGCRECHIEGLGWSNTNWKAQGEKSKYFDAYKVYIIKCFNEKEKFYKIGKTFMKLSKRFHNKLTMPYNYTVIKTFKGEAIEMCKLEKELQRQGKKYIPEIHFHGSKCECFEELSVSWLHIDVRNEDELVLFEA